MTVIHNSVSGTVFGLTFLFPRKAGEGGGKEGKKEKGEMAENLNLYMSAVKKKRKKQIWKRIFHRNKSKLSACLVSVLILKYNFLPAAVQPAAAATTGEIPSVFFFFVFLSPPPPSGTFPRGPTVSMTSGGPGDTEKRVIRPFSAAGNKFCKKKKRKKRRPDRRKFSRGKAG